MESAAKSLSSGAASAVVAPFSEILSFYQRMNFTTALCGNPFKTVGNIFENRAINKIYGKFDTVYGPRYLVNGINSALAVIKSDGTYEKYYQQWFDGGLGIANSGQCGGTSEYDWLQIYTEYVATGGEKGWLDGLQLQWSILVKEENGRFLLLHAEATYLDIETDAKEHRAVVYVRPSVGRRYCGKDRIPKSDVWVHVEAMVDGRVVAKEDYGRSRPPAANWWQAKDNKVVKVLEGALLTRDKTPFAPLDYDYYEHIKGTQGR